MQEFCYCQIFVFLVFKIRLFVINLAFFARKITSGIVLQIFLNEIGELKKQLAVERETRLAREAEVRQEVCEYFSNFWLKEQAECK